MNKIFLLVCLALFTPVLYANTKPNIVVVMVDDIGTGDVSYYTRNFLEKTPVFETPNIDRLANNGVWFSNGHSATALCSPTRYAIMTGKNNYRSYAPWGVWDMFRKNAIEEGETTLASVTKASGYKSAFIGKWHLGGDFKFKQKDEIFRGNSEQNLPQVDLTQMVGGGPSSLGFDYSFMLPDGIQGPVYLAYENEVWYPLNVESEIIHINDNTAYDPIMISDKGAGMGDSHWRTENIGKILSAKAVDFIKQHDGETPFMLYYASPMAHLPHMPPEEFDDIKVAGTTGSPHMDMIKEVDLQIGRIIDALAKKNVLENTLFIFTSDNGGLEYRVPGTKESGHKVSGIYRGSKNAPHEGGHRVPFIVHWPKQIKPNQISDEAVVVQDILATIASASGNKLDRLQAPDSNNLIPLLTGAEGFKSRQYMMLQGGSNQEVIFVEGSWKLIMQSDHELSSFIPIALFDLSDNLEELESKNLVYKPGFKHKVQKMRAKYLSIRESGEATAW